MNKPSECKPFYNGRLCQYRKMCNFCAQIHKGYLCLIVYSYPAAVLAMHLQKTFYTTIPVSTQTERCNISRVKVVQVKKALNLPRSTQRQLHNTGVISAAKRKQPIKRGNPNLFKRHWKEGRQFCTRDLKTGSQGLKYPQNYLPLGIYLFVLTKYKDGFLRNS